MTPLLILDLTAKSLAILLLAFAVQSFWRPASAAQRCLIWLVTFAGLLTLPLTLLIQPRWTPTVAALQRPQGALPLQTLTLLPGEAIQEALPQTGPESLARQSRLSPLQMAGLTWLAGVMLVLAHRGLGSWRLHWLRAQSSFCEDVRIGQQVTDLAQSLGIRRPVSVLTSTSISVPVTWGVWRPVLLLPRQALAWQEEALLVAILHELGHIRHRDAASRWLATSTCAIHWWNPLAWMAARAWRAVQEQAADDFVLRSGSSAQDYAMQLLQAARSFQESRLVRAPLLAMARPATLETRLSAIMDTGRNRRRVDRKGLSVAALAILLVMGGLSSMSLQGQPAQAPTPADPAKPAAGDAKRVAVAMRILEAPSGHLTQDPRIVSGKVLSLQEAKALSQSLLKDPLVKQKAAPRIVTQDRNEVVIRSGVNHPRPAGEPTVFIGTEAKVLPSISGEKLNLATVITLTAQVGEDKGLPVVSSRAVDASVEMAPGQTAIFALQSADKQPDMVALISPSVVADKAAANSKAKDKAAKIIFPRVQFSGATLDEAIEFLRVKARDLDPDRKGINILAIGQPKAQLSLDLIDVPMPELLRYVAELSDQDLQYDSNAVVLSPRGFFPRSAGLQPGSENAPVAVKAASIIAPRMDFRQAQLGDVVRFIRDDVRRTGPEEQGFNILLDDASPAAQKLITFDLQDISILDLLHYLAVLGDCTLTAEGTTFVLSPVAKP